MKLLTCILSLLISTYTFAGTGHGHGHGHSHGDGHGHSHAKAKKPSKIGPDVAEKLARNKIRVLAFQDKINESWNEAKLGTAIIKKFDRRFEWALTFTNDKGVKGKTIYVFLKENGDFIAANFTGK
jgi:hypothetical protein